MMWRSVYSNSGVMLLQHGSGAHSGCTACCRTQQSSSSQEGTSRASAVFASIGSAHCTSPVFKVHVAHVWSTLAGWLLALHFTRVAICSDNGQQERNGCVTWQGFCYCHSSSGWLVRSCLMGSLEAGMQECYCCGFTADLAVTADVDCMLCGRTLFACILCWPIGVHGL